MEPIFEFGSEKKFVYYGGSTDKHFAGWREKTDEEFKKRGILEKLSVFNPDVGEGNWIPEIHGPREKLAAEMSDVNIIMVKGGVYTAEEIKELVRKRKERTVFIIDPTDVDIRTRYNLMQLQKSLQKENAIVVEDIIQAVDVTLEIFKKIEENPEPKMYDTNRAGTILLGSCDKIDNWNWQNDAENQLNNNTVHPYNVIVEFWDKIAQAKEDWGKIHSDIKVFWFNRMSFYAIFEGGMLAVKDPERSIMGFDYKRMLEDTPEEKQEHTRKAIDKIMSDLREEGIKIVESYDSLIEEINHKSQEVINQRAEDAIFAGNYKLATQLLNGYARVNINSLPLEIKKDFISKEAI